MKNPATPKTAKVNGKEISRPPPHPLRKRPPKNNLGGLTKLFRAMGSDFRVPGRPVPRIRPPAGHPSHQKAATMKNTSTGAKSAKVNGKAVSRPAPHPPRKRKPKDSLEGVVKLFRALGPNFYVPGRPLPRPRRPDSTLP